MDERKQTFSNGSIIVYKGNKRHSEVGPALVSPWSINFYLEEKFHTPEEWAEKTNKTAEELQLILKKYEKYQREILIEYKLHKR